MTDLRPLIRAERLALADYLETLTTEQWATPSLCEGWTVRDVAAHLASAPVLGPGETVLGLARAGFRINRFIAESARARAGGEPVAIVAQLRENAEQGHKPTGMPLPAAMTDAVVHQLDVRRPLGSSRPVPPEAFRSAADFSAGARWPASMLLGGSVSSRIQGLRLVADDHDWSWGAGEEVHGAGEALLLMLTGRPIGRDELTGPGAEALYARL